MAKILKVAQFLDCKLGKSLDEAAFHFGVSKRSVQRWIDRIHADFPGLIVEESWDELGTKRFRCIGRSRLGAATFGKRDILALWSLTLAAEMMQENGLHDDADAITDVKAALLDNAPRAVRREIDLLIERLRKSEGVTGDGSQMLQSSRGVANKLRLAMLHEREVQLNLQDGRSISAHIDGVLRNPVACAQLNTGGENVIVPLEHIAEVAGVDDLCCDDFLRAA